MPQAAPEAVSGIWVVPPSVDLTRETVPAQVPVKTRIALRPITGWNGPATVEPDAVPVRGVVWASCKLTGIGAEVALLTVTPPLTGRGVALVLLTVTLPVMGSGAEPELTTVTLPETASGEDPVLATVTLPETGKGAAPELATITLPVTGIGWLLLTLTVSAAELLTSTGKGHAWLTVIAEPFWSENATA